MDLLDAPTKRCVANIKCLLACIVANHTRIKVTKEEYEHGMHWVDGLPIYLECRPQPSWQMVLINYASKGYVPELSY